MKPCVCDSEMHPTPQKTIGSQVCRVETEVCEAMSLTSMGRMGDKFMFVCHGIQKHLVSDISINTEGSFVKTGGICRYYYK